MAEADLHTNANSVGRKGHEKLGRGGGGGHDILPEELVCLHRGGDLALGFGGWSDFNVL